MGQDEATNRVSITTNALLSVMNTAAQKCTNPLTQEQVNSIRVAGAGSVLRNSTIRAGQSVVANFSCIQDFENNQDVRQQLQNQIDQQTQSIIGSLNLSLKSADAENISEIVSNLATEIQDSYTGTCASSVLQKQVNPIEVVDGGTIDNVIFDFDQSIRSMSECVQNTTNVQIAQQELENLLRQLAETQRKGIFDEIFGALFGNIAGIIIFIVVVIGILVILGLGGFFLIRLLTARRSKS